ncbi:hypothetical protein FHS91_001010 [Sphingobium xanthum]|jgi:hypothetical protein|uniref:BLUF domain-containing protein n=1 Tax=Sphingobium xanthum TaxID=1387165 RepID=UPI001C8B1DFD|nr:BLUF domain-containing protein [Sphingobium xanthum]
MPGKPLHVQQQFHWIAPDMTHPILQLTYISTRHPQMNPEEVDRILASSRRNNGRDRITGFLLFNGRRFLQHLEGPPDIVQATFERISADPRHRAVVVLGRKHVDSRIFGKWAMAFERVDSPVPERRMSLVAQVEALVAGIDPRVGDHFIGYARLTTNKAA